MTHSHKNKLSDKEVNLLVLNKIIYSIKNCYANHEQKLLLIME